MLGRGLRRIILSLLRRQPMNGAEIMRAVEGITWGLWRPSPGSVYPMLRQLEQEGLIYRREDGRYALTEGGRATARAMEPPWAGPTTVEDAVNELENLALYLEDMAAMEPDRVRALRDRIGEVARKLASLASA